MVGVKKCLQVTENIALWVVFQNAKLSTPKRKSLMKYSISLRIIKDFPINRS
jgi:hypothetical protein